MQISRLIKQSLAYYWPTNLVVVLAPVSPPLLLSPRAVGSDFIFSFVTLPGETYLIQYKDSLNAPFWQDLQTIPGDGSTLTAFRADGPVR